MFEARRKAFMERMGGTGVAVFHSCPEFQRSADSLEFTYRQDSNFYYLTGFEEPQAVCVLAPEHPEHKFILFVLPRNPKEETWTGRRAGPEGAVKQYGADAAYPLDELSTQLPEYLKGCKTLYYSSAKPLSFDDGMLDLLRKYRGKSFAPRQVVDPMPILSEMRVVKSAEELALMRKAAQISTQAYREILKNVKPGMYEYELQAILSYTYQKQGSARHGYAPIVGSGPNGTILHYDKNDRQMQDGDLVLIDSGCEYNYYNADITRTYPVSGRFTEPQRELYEIILEALETATAMVKPGLTLDEIHNQTVEIITTGLVGLGILKGDVHTLIEEKAYEPFYMYKACHWLGVDVHDRGPYKNGFWDEEPKLVPGMVFTIEPGVYIPEDAEDVDPKYWNIGIRIEDNVVVTEDGYENLTSDAPKALQEIEQLIASHA